MAVGVFVFFSFYLHTVDECEYSMLACAADVYHGLQERPCYASPHKLHINRVVHQPLTSSDREEPHRRRGAGSESHPDRLLLLWNQNSQAWLRLAQPGSNLVNTNCNHTCWTTSRVLHIHTQSNTHVQTHAHKLLLGSEVWVSHPVIAD